MDQPLSPLPAGDAPASADHVSPTPGARALQALRALGPARLLILGVTGLALLMGFGYLVMRAVEPPYTLLYGALELDDSAQIVSRLEAMAVPFRLQGDGSAIMVPADQALRLRMTLAEENLPRGGTVGDEIFDQGSALGTTNFLANVNLRRALEGELARTIASLADVRSARVHLVLPRHELFRRDQIEASASITLRMQGGRRLSHRQVQAIEHLVAAAVPGLVPERIAVVDDQGTLLARGDDGASAAALPSQADEFREAYEAHLKQAIEQLLERSLGPGRVEAQVNADLDFDQVTTTEETYDPDGQVVRSTQTVEENKQNAERTRTPRSRSATTCPTPPPRRPPPAGPATRTASAPRRRSTTRSRTRCAIRPRSAAGCAGCRWRSWSTARWSRTPRASWSTRRSTPPSSPRSRAWYARRSASTPIAATWSRSRTCRSAAATARGRAIWPQLTRSDLMRLAELAALALVALMLILLVVRPTLRRLLPAPAPALATTGAARWRGALPAAAPALAAPDAAEEGEPGDEPASSSHPRIPRPACAAS